MLYEKNKFFSILTSIIMFAGMACSTFSAAAVNNDYGTGSLPVAGKDFYTLSQLFEMSD